MTKAIVKSTKAIAKTKQQPAQYFSGPKCGYRFSDTRTCAMPRWRQHRMFCMFHAHQAQQLVDANRIGNELTSFTGEFRTITDLNRALGNLFKAVAQNRIPPKNAAVLAYIGQLLSQTIPSAQEEISTVDGDAVENIIRGTLDLADEEYGVEEDDEGEEADEEAEEESEEKSEDDKSDESVDSKQNAEATTSQNLAATESLTITIAAENTAAVEAATAAENPPPPPIPEIKLPAPYPPPNPNAFAQYHHLMDLKDRPPQRPRNRRGFQKVWYG